MSLILASNSPRRKELLERMGLEFTVIAANVDETMDLLNHRPEAEAMRIAKKKARSVPAGAGDIVISADTIVVIDGQVLGKPSDEGEAERMLSALSGKRHTVYTAVAVIRDNTCVSFVSKSGVYFRELAPSEIRAYVSSGEPKDKAGAYGVQGLGALFIDRIDGDFYTVMGLPVARLAQTLRIFGIKIL